MLNRTMLNFFQTKPPKTTLRRAQKSFSFNTKNKSISSVSTSDKQIDNTSAIEPLNVKALPEFPAPNMLRRRDDGTIEFVHDTDTSLEVDGHSREVVVEEDLAIQASLQGARKPGF